MVSRTRRDRTQWQKLVDLQIDSGLSAAAFCRQNGIGYPSFMSWRKRLSQIDAECPAVGAGQFIELTGPSGTHTAEQPVSSVTAALCVELSLGHGIELRISTGG